jgi:hypothetical protein
LPIPSSLLIGIGNPLRGDDGVGPWLVETWGRRRGWRRAARGKGGERLTPIRVRVVDQLLPEVAEELAAVRRVLFVDAWRVEAGGTPADGEATEGRGQGRGLRGIGIEAREPLSGGPRLLPIAAVDPDCGSGAGWDAAGWTPGHRLTPAVLLQLSAGLFGRVPAAESLLIPAMAFAATDPAAGPGRFSADLRRQLPRAWQLLNQWSQAAEETSVSREA